MSRLARQCLAEVDRARARLAADDDHMRKIGQFCEDRLENGQERAGDTQRAGARIRQHIGVLLGDEQRIERDRHDAGAQGAEEGDRRLDRIEHDERDALLAPEAERSQQPRETASLRLQLAIGELSLGVDEDELVAAPLLDIAVEQIGAGVVA